MSTHLRFASLSLFVVSFVAAPLCAQEAAADNAQPDAAAMEKMMAEYAKVTENHEGFKKLVGTWNTDMQCSMPGSPSGPMQGEAKFRLLMGGRFLQQDFKSQFGEQQFRGMGLTGYDNAQKKYVGVWIDNMGTGIMHTTGAYDEKTHVMTEMGESQLPTGPMKMKMVTKPVSDNEFVFTMYMLTPDDGEQLIMQITYKRAEEAAATKATSTKAEK